MKLDIVKLVHKYKDERKINPRYDASLENLRTIISTSEESGIIWLLYDAFVFGYAQGYKAKTAEIKKRNEVTK